MAKKDPKRRQKRLQKKAAKRKQRRAAVSRQMQAFVKPSLNKAKDWPLHEVWMTENWRKKEQLIQILVARRGPKGFIAIGNVLVDTMCLGAKNAYGRVVSEGEYIMVLHEMQGNQSMIPTDINLVAKVIRDSVAYARDLGISPNRDLGQALRVIGKTDPDACLIEIPLGGPDGRPFFFGGPYDNYGRIIKKLTNAVGPDGFTYLLPLDQSDPWGDEFIHIDEVEFTQLDEDNDILLSDDDVTLLE